MLLPYGPLKIMIESAQRHKIEIPDALIYSVMAYKTDENNIPIAAYPDEGRTREDSDQQKSTSTVDQNPNNELVGQQIQGSSREAAENLTEGPTSIQGPSGEKRNRKKTKKSTEDDNGMKLGLGDFVFYSVLVAQASLLDWITTVTSMVAVTSGLCFTIVLLLVYNKPLPALPISIAFGILFYFVAGLTLSPLADAIIKGNTDLGQYVYTASSGSFVCL